MRKDFAKECSGCCWMKKSGELYFVCIFIECPFHPQYIGHSEQCENVTCPIASDFVS